MHGYAISTDSGRLDRRRVHAFLTDSYWSPGVPFDVVDRSIERSLCFGLYAPDGSQAGFARAVTDGAQFAYLADVFVLEPHRGRGLGKWLVETVLAHPDLTAARRIVLATADAHSLYERFGFRPADPGRVMELVRSPEDIWD
ncbi:MAG TPA: GNAT family N-acetyltransferase [Thermoleophilaceae bacterium]|nr:GNAT family N-acetyltransferase [Thermoleophilaceae bacterium]